MNDAYLITKLNVQGCSGVVVKKGILYSCSTTPEFLIVPKGIVGLYRGCLSGQDSLIEVTLPDTLQEIGLSCFANCPNLTRIRCKSNLDKFHDMLKSGNKGVIINVYTIGKI